MKIPDECIFLVGLRIDNAFYAVDKSGGGSSSQAYTLRQSCSRRAHFIVDHRNRVLRSRRASGIRGLVEDTRGRTRATCVFHVTSDDVTISGCSCLTNAEC